MKIEDEFLDVLQNLEIAILSVYHDHPQLTDSEVTRTLQALGDVYVAETLGRRPRDYNLSPLENELLSRLQDMADWRLGRRSSPDGNEDHISEIPPPLTKENMISCLGRILKSVKKWNKHYGVRGYLDFINDHVPGLPNQAL